LFLLEEVVCMKRWDLVLWGSVAFAVLCLCIGLIQLFSDGGGAEWLTAAGGFGLIAFAAVQLRLEEDRESQRREAARAKIKPVARLARRSCERAVIESNGGALNNWLGNWYRTNQQGVSPMDALEELMRETVTLAAEAGDTQVQAADAAFDAFIAAADIINDMSRTLTGAQEDRVLRDNNPGGRVAANHLATAARELETLAPRRPNEPALPAHPRFMHGEPG
jgi:hypothetical protein